MTTATEAEQYLDKLRTALTLVEALKQEKELYKDNFERLKNLHEELRVNAEGVVRERDEYLADKIALEEENETLANKLRETEGRARELEEIRAQLVEPKDIELLRLEIVDAVEEQQKRKWQFLNEENEKYRQQYFSLKKEYELLKTTYEKQISEHQAVLSEVNAVHEEEVRSLDIRIQGLQSSLLSSSEADKLRQLQRDNNELQAKVTHLKREVEDLRTRKEASEIQSDQQERLNQRKLLEEASVAKAITSEKEALAARIRSMEDELRSAIKTHDIVVEENRQLHKELSTLRSRHEEAVHKFNVEVSDLKLAIVKEKSHYENVVNEWRQKFNEAQNTIKVSNECIAEHRQKLAQHDRDASERLRITREEEWAKLERVETEKSELEKMLEGLRHRRSELEMLLETQRKELQAEIVHLRKEQSEATVRAENVLAQNIALETETERLRSTLTTMQARSNEYEAKILELSEHIEKSKQSEQSMREHMATVETMTSALQLELSNTNEMLHKERRTYVSNLERLKFNASKEQLELQAVVTSLEEENNFLKEHAQRHAQSYDDAKKKFSQLKDKLKSYKLVAETAQLELSNLKKQTEVEKLRSESEKKETRMRQSEFLTLLQSELLAPKSPKTTTV